MVGQMSKGTKRERQARDLYSAAGWMAWRPKTGTNPYAGDPDVFEEFDVMAIHPLTGEFHAVQVKSNGARGLKSYSRRMWPYTGAGMEAMYLVPYDRDGWRLIRVHGPEEWSSPVDERNEDCAMGEHVVEFLRRER